MSIYARLIITLFSVITLVLTGFKEEATLIGIWTRKEDGLVIEVKGSGESNYIAYIVQEGAEKFPCDIGRQPIYKNIIKKNAFWTCDFLVVEIGRCSSEYMEGTVRITKKGEMEVNCPGFGKKYYVKKSARYNPTNGKMAI
jgi:hypothetical protein